jgi:hypothetical protein
MEQPHNQQKWEDFLDPENLKDNLLFSSLFIAYFESFKEYVVDEVKFFFNTGFTNGEYTFSDDYKNKVLIKDKSPVKATLLWLIEMEAAEDNDVLLYDQFRQLRNELSHNLMSLLFEGLPKDLPEKLMQLINLRVKIEKWWILNVEIPTGMEFESDKIPGEEDITTGSQIISRLIFDMLSGDEKKANYYKQEFEKRFK